MIFIHLRHISETFTTDRTRSGHSHADPPVSILPTKTPERVCADRSCLRDWHSDRGKISRGLKTWGQTCLTENLSQVAFIRTKHISGVIYLVLIRIVMNFGILIIPSASWVSLINDHVGHVAWQLLGTKWACPCCRAQKQSCVIEVIAICWCPSAPPNVTWVQQLEYFTDEPEEL